MLRRLQQLFLRWQRNDAGLMSAAVAYYAVVSMFPLLLILTSGLGVFLRWTNRGQDAQIYILNAISEQVSPSLAENVRIMLDQVQQHASFNGPVGFATLFFAAMAMFAHFERAFDRIWKVEAKMSPTFAQTVLRVVTHRLRAFVMLVSVGAAVIVVFFAGVGFKAVRAFGEDRIGESVWFWWSMETLLILVLNAIVFGLLYKFLPKARVRWIHAMRGGLFATICWEFGRQILATFVIGTRYSSAYGLIGSLLAIMLWAYYSFGVIFLGAIYAQLLGEENEGDKTHSSAPSPRLPGESVALLMLLYVGSFLAMRHYCAHRIPSYQSGRSVVIFSRTVDGQQWGKLVFAPLIAVLPGAYAYPNGVDIPEILRQLQSPEMNEKPSNRSVGMDQTDESDDALSVENGATQVGIGRPPGQFPPLSSRAFFARTA